MYDRALHAQSFARQFGYDQLYIGNPKANLSFSENLFEGARAWYYNVTGGTKAIFSLPRKTSNIILALASVLGTSWLVGCLVLE